MLARLSRAGLYALGAAILGPAAFHGELVAVLWLVSFVAIMALESSARSAAGRASPAERCLVIGDPHRAHRIREKLGSSRAHASVIATISR